MRRLLPASRSWYALVVSATLAACGGGGGGDPTEPPDPTVPAAAVRANENTNGQSAAVGTAVANAPAVRVTNSAGTPLTNVTVTFAVTTGGGALGATSAQTNAQGIASAGSWTLGATPGAQRVTATVGTLTPVTFDATATTGAPVNLAASRVDVGAVAVKCVARASGVVSCWGENSTGTLGDGTTTFRAAPVNLSVTGVNFATVTVGAAHGCALTTAGAAYCWGRNDAGMVGDGSSTNRLAPVAVSGNHVFASLVAGPTYTCGVKADGTVWCWGTQNGGTATTRRTAPTQLNTGGRTVTSVAVTLDGVCGAVQGGGVMCWTGNIYTAAAPAVTSPTITFATLTGGGRHQCGLAADGRAYCWGVNQVGQLGVDDIDDRAAPTLVVGGRTYVAIEAGVIHTCALTSAGEAYCWGSNTSGQVGNGVFPTGSSGGAYDTPQRVAAPTGVQFASIGIGGYASCGIASTSNHVYCWGAQAVSNATSAVQGIITPTAIFEP